MNHQLFTNIVDLVSHFTQVNEEEIFSKSRKKALVDARYMVIYIARQLDIRLVYIQRYFKLRGFELHYTTLFHACKRLEKDKQDDMFLSELVDSILLQLDPSKVLTPELTEDIIKSPK